MDLKIADLLNKDHQFHSHNEMSEKVKWNINILNSYSFMDAIPKSWKSQLNTNVVRHIQASKFSIPCHGTLEKGNKQESLLGYCTH